MAWFSAYNKEARPEGFTQGEPFGIFGFYVNFTSLLGANPQEKCLCLDEIQKSIAPALS